MVASRWNFPSLWILTLEIFRKRPYGANFEPNDGIGKHESHFFWHSGKVSLQMYFFQNIQGESSLIRDFCFAEVVDEYASLFTSHFTSYSFVELYSCSTLLALPMCIYFSVDKRVWNLVLQHYKSASEILIPRYSHCSIPCVGISNVLNSFQL